MFSTEQIAHVVHEANRALQRILGDRWVSPAWWEAPLSQRDSLINGVQKAIEGSSAEELHEEWVRWRAEQGWRYGRVKDEFARTHPCMIPYDRLPREQRVKDELLRVIVQTLAVELSSVEKA